MGTPFTQSITLIQRRNAVWNLLLREVLGCSRVVQAMTSTMTGKHTATANIRRAKRRRCMLDWDWAVPTTISLAHIMPPFGDNESVPEKNFAIIQISEYFQRKAAPAREPHPIRFSSFPLTRKSRAGES